MLGYVIQIATSLFAASPSTLTLKEELANSAILRTSLDVSCLLSTGEGRDQSIILYCALLLLYICIQQGKFGLCCYTLGPKIPCRFPT